MPFLAHFFGFIGTPCQYDPILQSDMTQGRSQIVSGANLDSMYDKFEPFFDFLNKKKKIEIFLADFLT